MCNPTSTRSLCNMCTIFNELGPHNVASNNRHPSSKDKTPTNINVNKQVFKYKKVKYSPALTGQRVRMCMVAYPIVLFKAG